MDPIIKMQNVNKEFKVLKRREGVKGSINDLFSRNYQIIKAVSDISITINAGEVVGYLGPNGAGKSTTIKMLTGILEPTSGEILVNGKNPFKNRTQNAQNIGVVFGQRTQLWWALPVIESFHILKNIYKIDDAQFRDMLELYDSLIDIKMLYHKPVRQLSLGQRTLCDILAAFLHSPSVVFLDEPTIGLDVSMKSKIRNLINTLNKKQGTTVILTTHDMGDVDALCKRVVIIDKGSTIYDNNIKSLREYFGACRLLKLNFDKDFDASIKASIEIFANELKTTLKEKFGAAESITVSSNGEWVDILINEDEVPIIEVINYVQNRKKIYDIKLEEISTESVIKKIYEGESGKKCQLE